MVLFSGVVIETLTPPNSFPAGTVTVMELVVIATMVAMLFPKRTIELSGKLVPNIVTVLPPASGPKLGLMALIFVSARWTYSSAIANT